MTGLHIDSVIKYFGIKHILNDIFITCEKGEIVGILGRNGSGKSTLMKIIFGSISAENKFVMVGSKPINTLADSADTIRYLPQSGFLPTHVNIRKLISVFCGKQNAQFLFTHELVKPYLDKKSEELSGGQRRILEIVMTIYSDAQYFLLDEPFNGVAPIQVDLIKELIRDQLPNKGFIITDHDYKNILELSTKIVLMKDGSIKLIKNQAELIEFGYLPVGSVISH